MKWSQYFAPATYSGAPPYGAGDFDPGEIGPECIVLHEIRRHLLADTKLATIFGADRIVVVDGPNPYDYENLPKIQIYAGDTSEIKAPSSTNSYTVSAQIELRYQPSALGTIQPGDATVAAVAARIKRALKANIQLVTQVSGDQRQIAKNSNAGPVVYRYDIDPAGGRYAVAQIIGWVYYLDIDYGTGQIRTLQ